MWDLIVSVPDNCLSFYFSFSLSCAVLSTTLIPAGRAPAIATKIGKAGTRASTAPHPRSPARI